VTFQDDCQMAVTFRQKPGGLSEYLGSYGSRFHNGSARILFTTKTRRREGILCDSACLRGEILGLRQGCTVFIRVLTKSPTYLGTSGRRTRQLYLTSTRTLGDK